MMKSVDRPKLVVKSLGNPRTVIKMTGDNPRLILGVVYGIANKTKMKTVPDRAGNPQTVSQILGNFEGIPAEPIKDGDDLIGRISSNVLYLPEVVHVKMVEALSGKDAQPIRFAFEVSAVKSKGSIGYAWEFTQIIPTAAVDPMAEIRAAVEKHAAEKSAPPAPGLVKAKHPKSP